MQVKIFGERNTGTRLLRSLVESIRAGTVLPSTAEEIDPAAFRAIQQTCWKDPITREAAIDRIFLGLSPREAWKHCATDFDTVDAFSDCVVLITVKHPAAWLVSLVSRPYHALSTPPETLRRLLEFQWKTVGRERLDERTFTPIQLYNEKIRSYRHFVEQLREASITFKVLRSEDLILNQAAVFRTIAGIIGCPHARFKPIEASTKSPGVQAQHYFDYYAHERWRDELAGVHDSMNGEVEWDQLRAFGYEPV